MQRVMRALNAIQRSAVIPPVINGGRAQRNGLRAQVLNAIDLDTRNEYVYSPRNLISRNSPGLSVGEREDVLLRKYVAIRNAQSNVSGFSNMAVSYSPSIGEQYRAANDGGFFSTIANGTGATASIALDLTTNAVAGIGAIISSPGHLAAGIAARDGANHIRVTNLNDLRLRTAVPDGLFAVSACNVDDLKPGVLRLTFLLRTLGDCLLG